MSDYKNYLLRAMGVSESKKPTDGDIAKAAKKEKEEHPQLSKKDAELIAKQHLTKNGVKEGLLSTMVKCPLMSPTAIATPVIGVAVRGSSTGGLPSGADQVGDISPSRLGGYEKVVVDPVNSKLVNKTPSNPDINQNEIPIIDDPVLQGGVTHTHQVQKNAGDQPQQVTGASTDTDDTLKLKSAMPKGIDIDIAQEGNNEPTDMNSHIKREQSDLNETFTRHKEFMKTKLKLQESSCECGDPDCKCKVDTDECKNCGCGNPNTSHDMREGVGATEPFETKWKMDSEKAGLVKISEAFDRMGSLAGLNPLKEEKKDIPKAKEQYSVPFERMRGLANLGERKLGGDGLWLSESKKEAKCSVCGKTFVPTHGEYSRCSDCLSSQQSAAEKATGVQETLKENRIPIDKLQSIKETLDKKSKKGTLNDKELILFRKLEEVLKRRQTGLDKQSQAVDKQFGKMEKDPSYRPFPFDKDRSGPMRHGNEKGQLPAK